MNRPLTNPPADLRPAATMSTRRPSPFWAILLVALAAVITLESLFDWGLLVRQQTAMPSGSAETSFDFAAGGRIDRHSDYSDYLAAPIFLASREPIFLPDPTRASVTSARPGEFGLALLGTILSEDEPVALLKALPGGEVVLLRQGEELGGWSLLEIEGRLVRLQRAGDVIELYLDPDQGVE